MLVGQDNGQLSLLNVTNGKCIRLFDGHSDWILALEAHWPSMRAVSGGGDGSVYLWDLSRGTGHQLGPSDGARSCIRTIAVQWDPSEHLTSPGRATSSAAQTSASLTATAPSLTAVSGFAGRALTGADSGRLAMWGFDSRRCEKVFNFRLGIIASLAVDWSKFRALVGHGDKGLDLMDLEAETRLRSFPGHACIVGAIAVSWSKASALCGSGDGTLSLWDLRKGSQVRTLKGHKGAVYAVSAHWSSMRGVTGSTDNVLYLWDLKQGECIRMLHGHAAPVQALSAAWEKGYLLSSSVDGSMRLWQIGTEGKSDRGQEKSKMSSTTEEEEAPNSEKPLASIDCSGATTISLCPQDRKSVV